MALANKESLVAGGSLVLDAASPGQIVPVDSEHSALAQCLRGGSSKELDHLVPTASGGPFRTWTRERIAAALADEVAQASGLTLSGLMAVAPRGEEPERAFERLAALRESFLADHPAARVLSAGMSGDLEAAVKIGATHLRVGSAILGSRPAAR